MARLLILTIGPFAIITVAYWIAAPSSSAAVVTPIIPQKLITQRQPAASQDLTTRCQNSAKRLKKLLPSEFQIVIRAPFLIAGDLPVAQLEKIHADVIGPVARALRETYFESAPREPITIVVCSTEDLFRQLAYEWDGHLEAGYHGYYQRDKRRILLDLEAGNGSLAHELTHALSHADCEDLPEWFDEGLGALYEEAEFASRGQHLVGLPNWRCKLTRRAAHKERLPALEKLTDPAKFRTGDVGLNYAMARSICLFLQDRQVLQKYYAELRTRPRSDAKGIATLCGVLGVNTASQVEGQFAAWVKRRPN